MIATKNHFLFIVKGTEVKDELYAAEGYPAGNPIGFFAQGSAVAFKKETLNGSWEKYSERHIAPILHIRSINSLFGATAETDDVVYVTIIPREDALHGTPKQLNNASVDEELMIQNSNETFQVGSQCNIEIYRDLNTFDVVDPEIVSLEIDLTIAP
jgi:hypothetical protein